MYYVSSGYEYFLFSYISRYVLYGVLTLTAVCFG